MVQALQTVCSFANKKEQIVTRSMGLRTLRDSSTGTARTFYSKFPPIPKNKPIYKPSPASRGLVNRAMIDGYRVTDVYQNRRFVKAIADDDPAAGR